MQRMKAHKERIKTLLIFLLTASAAFLGWHIGLFDAPIQAGGFLPAARPPIVSSSDHISPAARPTAVMASLGEGNFQGHRMNQAETTMGIGSLFPLYNLFAPHLGDALGSASRSEPISETQWQDALSDLGVFFHYDVAVPGDVLAGWFGQTADGALGLMQRLYLSFRQDVVHLYYMAPGQAPRRSVTDIPTAPLRAVLHTLAPNGAEFGFLQTAWTGTDPYTVLLPAYGGIQTLQDTSAIGTIFGQLDTVLEQFGMSLARARYVERDGVRTMVQDGATLRLSENGRINFHCQDDVPRLTLPGDEPPTLAEAIHAAHHIVQALFAPFSEWADLYLTDWSAQDGRFVLQFGYYFGSVPIWTEYPAAVIVIEGQAVREIDLFARSFRPTGQFTEVIPELQAVAAAGGTPLTLTYVPAEDGAADNETAVMHARWLLPPDREERGE